MQEKIPNSKILNRNENSSMSQMLIQPIQLKKVSPLEFKIVWSDQHESLYTFRYLRQHCQCAFCVDEWSGKPLLEREKISQQLEGVNVQLVGQYALRIDFSDGHNTGIFPFKQLRGICPCCKK